MNNLTLVAALPQAGGCMATLPAEKNESPWKYDPICDWWTRGKQTKAQDPSGNWLVWPSIVFLDEEPAE